MLPERFGNNGVYARVRTTDVRAISLENRQSFTGLVSSNLTLSAKAPHWDPRHGLAGSRRIRVVTICSADGILGNQANSLKALCGCRVDSERLLHVPIGLYLSSLMELRQSQTV